MKTVKASYIINYPAAPSGTVGFSFSCDTGAGNFQFVFKYVNSQWNGWATLPTGEVRQFGCIPGVVDWTEFMDYGIVIDTTLTVIGLNDLVGNTTLYLLVWGVD